MKTETILREVCIFGMVVLVLCVTAITLSVTIWFAIQLLIGIFGAVPGKCSTITILGGI